ncbi:hypothetical protein LTR50_003702 [Elasticomyces elasticus]|nr:hypothetical protein LTR50_003702 [Elasticomyces elasticus]
MGQCFLVRLGKTRFATVLSGKASILIAKSHIKMAVDDFILPASRRGFHLLLVFQLYAGSVHAQNRPTADWTGQCAIIIESLLNNGENIRLVDKTGIVNGTLTRDNAWGITVQECYNHCGAVTAPFSFANFSSAATNWLLPWVALSAQLPYETSGPFNNVMSMLLAVGSPAFITYGLFITMLNRFRIARKFEELSAMARDPFLAENWPGLETRLQCAKFMLQESQQAPMRAYEGNGWLSSLLLLEANQPWWVAVHKHLYNTRRGVTISLILQILFAVVAWLFTVIAAFENLGDVVTALSISSSSIWLWMVPVITGWVAVETQSRKQSIRQATEENNARTYRAPPNSDLDARRSRPLRGNQDGIKCSSGIIPLVTLPLPGVQASNLADLEHTVTNPNSDTHGHPATDVELSNMSPNVVRRDPRSTTVDGISDAGGDERLGYHDGSRSQETVFHQPTHDASAPKDEPGTDPATEPLIGLDHQNSFISERPSRWGVEFMGDESNEGPIHNYARVFTSVRFAEVITNSYSKAIRKIQKRQTPTGTWQPRTPLRDNIHGSAAELARFCGLDSSEACRPYAKWDEIPGAVWHNIFIASVVAIFVQWGTTGPAILIGYLTPTTGLGCRSGGYLLYGVLATTSWILLMGSSFLSHALMLRCQNNPRSTPVRGPLPAICIFMRVSGKSLAAFNAVWLLLSSVFELAGVFDTCWCNSDYLGSRSKGWILLFASSDKLAATAAKTWIGGIMFLAAVCFIASGLIWLGCKDDK